MKSRYIIVFRSRSQRLHLRSDGRAISSKGKAKRFASYVEARKVMRSLCAAHPVLANYKPRVEALSAIKMHKNPSAFARAAEKYSAELDRADDLQRSFTGHDSKKIFRVTKKPIKAGFAIGPMTGIAYLATRDGETKDYFHRFAKKSRPLLFSSSDGTQLDFVGGHYQFTDRGIEDR